MTHKLFKTASSLLFISLYIFLSPQPTHASIIDESPVTRKIFLIIFNPTIESQSNQKLTTLKSWQDPVDLTNKLIAEFPIISHGYLSYAITQIQEVDGYPVKSDGFQYTDATYLNCLANTSTCHSPDIINYSKIITDFNVCQKEVDEVWLWGGPYFGYYEYNPIPACGKTMFVMGYNYERGLAEALHDFGHRMEFVGIRRVGDGNWVQNEANEWNKFSLINGHCGNVHNPPYAPEGYNYSKTDIVTTDCDGYLTYPAGPFSSTKITCTAWDCSQLGFMRWWLSHIPSNPGSSVINNKNLYHNWWKYYVYYDETANGIIPTIKVTNDPRIRLSDAIFVLRNYLNPFRLYSVDPDTQVNLLDFWFYLKLIK